MRFAYADPPYLGCCALYGHFHGDDGRCWDDPETHRLLIARLVDTYPDGFALSLSTPSIRTILPMCPADVRVASWVKTFLRLQARRAAGVRVGARRLLARAQPQRRPPAPPPPRGGKQTTPKDFVAVPITLKKGLTGAKPRAFCAWVLDLLNVQPGDIVDDIFPGTGVMTDVARERTEVRHAS